MLLQLGGCQHSQHIHESQKGCLLIPASGAIYQDARISSWPVPLGGILPSLLPDEVTIIAGNAVDRIGFERKKAR